MVKQSLLLFLLSLSLISYSQTIQENLVQKEIEKKSQFLQVSNSTAGQNIDVKHYRCEWEIDPAVRRINGKVTTTFVVKSDTATQIIFDFYNGLTVDSVKYGTQKLAFGFSTQNLFWIKTGTIFYLNELKSISIFYKGIPNNSGFGAFNKQNHAGQPIIWTLSCPYAARDWWPCKQNLEDKADSIDLIITTPSNCKAAGNGILIGETASGNFKTYHWKHKYPIATYLIATAVTNYASFTNKVHLPSQNPGDSLPIVNFVYPESLNGALISTQKIIPILQFYDSLVAPYPFRKEKYGHAQFGWGGGMEHQTMSFMTDFSFGLQAHELAHQWFGDFITCKSWRDIWLNEGWATYMAAISENRFGVAGLSSWLTSSQNSVKAQANGSVWVSDTTNINRIFDYRLTYLKGALVLHMLRWEIGDVAFWQGVRNYQADPSLGFGFSSTANFIQHLETSSGKNLSEFLNDWFTGQGYPTYNLKLIKNGLNMQLTINQTTSHPSVPFFEMKVPVRFRATGFDTVLIFKNDSSGQIFNFALPFSPTTITFDPEKWIIAKNTVQIITANEDLIQPKNGINIFPNPFSEILTIENNYGKPIEVKIFDSLGKMIIVKNLATEIQQKIDLSKFSSGNYIVKYRDATEEKVIKVVKR